MDTQKAVPIGNCLRYLESTLFHNRFLMSPTTLVILESIEAYLKEYKKMKEDDVKPTSG